MTTKPMKYRSSRAGCCLRHHLGDHLGGRSDLVTAGAYGGVVRAGALQPKVLQSVASLIVALRHIRCTSPSVRADNLRWSRGLSAVLFAAVCAQVYCLTSLYVDWAGEDGYNWAPECPESTWTFWEQLFSPFYGEALSVSRPLPGAEYGIVEVPPGARVAWFMHADHDLRAQFFAILAVDYFNSDHNALDRYVPCGVTSSPSALAASPALRMINISVPDIKVNRVTRQAFDGGPCHVRITTAG